MWLDCRKCSLFVQKHLHAFVTVFILKLLKGYVLNKVYTHTLFSLDSWTKSCLFTSCMYWKTVSKIAGKLFSWGFISFCFSTMLRWIITERASPPVPPTAPLRSLMSETADRYSWQIWEGKTPLSHDINKSNVLGCYFCELIRLMLHWL